MTRKTLAVISLVLVVVMAVAALILGSGLPADARLPVHWNVYGEPDRFAGKWVALLAPATFTALLSLFFYFLPVLEPRRKGLERSVSLYMWGWVSLLMIGIALMATVGLTAAGREPPVVQIMAGSVGLLLILIGNAMGKSRSMYLFGIRTPWTLANEEVWIKTHRLGGKLTVAGGFAMLGAVAAGAPRTTLGIMALVVAIVAAGVPAVYSYVQWRREMARAASDGSEGK